MGNERLNCHDCENDEFVDLLLESGDVVSILFEFFENATETSFVSGVWMFGVAWLLKMFVLFVDGVICQVSEYFAQVIRSWFSVRFGTEAGHSFTENVNPKWVNGTNKCVNAKIELQPFE